MPADRDLTLPEQILLLSLHDEKGTVQTWMFTYGVAGAILTELLDRGLLAVEERDGRRVVVTGGLAGTGDPLLDECARTIGEHDTPLSIGAWITRFSSLNRLRDRVAEPLCHLGVLTRSADRLLWIFPRVLYPTADETPEQQLMRDLRSAIESEGEIEPEIARLLALAYAAEILEANFGRALLKERRDRLEAVLASHETARATREVIEVAQATVAMAVAPGVC